MRKLNSFGRSGVGAGSVIGANVCYLLLTLATFLLAGKASAQTSFTNAEILPSTTFGSVTNDNSFPLWYQWTAPSDGDVTVDTFGSVPDSPSNYNGFPVLDTVLAVFTGTTESSLNQVAANDDAFPGLGAPQFLLSGSADQAFKFNYLSRFSYPFYGPSELHFTAKMGTTYYFAADTKKITGTTNASTGTIALSWAYKPSGVFRFATENVDKTAMALLYETAGSESSGLSGDNAFSLKNTYYNYNAQGLLVTITRVGGAVGRVSVGYQTIDGTNFANAPINDYPGVAGIDYSNVSGTLIFDDFEMSKTILIPVPTAYANQGGNPNVNFTNNLIFGILLTNAQADPFEANDVPQPRIDPVFGTAMIRVLNVNADPYGPDFVTVTNMVGTNLVTSLVAGLPTNAIFNFEKANYRVPADVNNSSNTAHFWPQVLVYVQRSGTNNSAQTINYRVNNLLDNDKDNSEEGNNDFPLQPGSDYATPDPSLPQGGIRGRNSDFTLAQGTITFGANDVYKPISFTVTNSSLTKFNKDFKIQLYQEVGSPSSPMLVGMVNETTVTILFNDLNPPAGSVDELYNADFNGDLALQPGTIPDTPDQENNPNPGADQQVYSAVNTSSNETLIGGAFLTYNGVGRCGVALVQANGALDTSFDPGSGANDVVHAVGITPDGQHFVIAGNFTSFNGNTEVRVARLNTDGSVDPTFSANVDDSVQALAIQPDGRLLIGGKFTHVNGSPCNSIARLNADGSLDTSFNVTNVLSGTIDAIALPDSSDQTFSATKFNITNEFDQAVLIGGQSIVGATNGQLSLNWASFNNTTNGLPTTNDFQIYYGGTINGVLIYDSGMSAAAGNVNTAFGPTNGVIANFITVVVNSGGVMAPGSWHYNGSITTGSTNTGIIVGGDFSVLQNHVYGIAKLTANGLLDTTFAPIAGVDAPVLALSWQPDDKIVAGGVFNEYDGINENRILRLAQNGKLDTGFYSGTGANDIVYSIVNYNSFPNNNLIYIGGTFSSYNGTRRMGFARLYDDGTLDTSFLDTAYNQFAGLKKIYSYDTPAVYTSTVMNDGGVIIGGAFNQVGGGQFDPNVCNTLDEELSTGQGDYLQSFSDSNLWLEPKVRDGVRNRSNIARLIGGATPGPGNIELGNTSFSANRSQSSTVVSLVRTNGSLGPVSANFSIVPGSAVSGGDYFYDNAPPLYWVAWNYIGNNTRDIEDGLFGKSGFEEDVFGQFLSQADSAVNNLSKVTVTVLKDSGTAGNLSAQFQLANPVGSDLFYLGGQPIPLGGALGVSSAPFNLIDDNKNLGSLGFSQSAYVATNASTVITLVRSNGFASTIEVRVSTTNGTALAGSDYVSLNNLTESFAANVHSNTFFVKDINSGINYTNYPEKYYTLYLSGVSSGVTYGISNAVVRIINPNFQGYLTLGSTNYVGAESSGGITFLINRVSGSKGTLRISYATADKTAISGVDYLGTTNQLEWDNGDASSRLITVPLLNSGVVGVNKQFVVNLFGPQLNGTNWLPLFGPITNATLTISNDNSYGTLQLSTPLYNVNENGGYATITAVRTSGAGGAASVGFNTTPGANTAPGVNYVPTNGLLVFAANQLAASFNVPLIDDGVVDGTPFNFNVYLTNASNATLGSPSNAVIQILDDSKVTHPPGSVDTTFSTNGMNSDVLALALQGNNIIAAGSFTYAGGVPRNYIARLNQNGTVDTTFMNGLPGPNGNVLATVNQTDNRLLIGGNFTAVNGVHANFLARLLTDGTLDSSFNIGAGADGSVDALAETFIAGSREIYVGGGFGNFNNTPSSGLVRLNNDATLDSSFTIGTGFNGTVNAVAVYATNSVYAGKLIVAGSFTYYQGQPQPYLVRLNQNGSIDQSFNVGTGPNSTVRSLAIQLDGRVLVGGTFTNFNGTLINGIVRLNADGSVDTNFVGNIGSGADGVVNAIAIQPDNRIFLGGQFSHINGVTRNSISRLSANGAVDTSINFGTGADGAVDAIQVQPTDGLIVLGGGFTHYNSQVYNHIVRIYGGSITGSGLFEFTAQKFYANDNAGYAGITILRLGGTAGTNADGSGDTFVQFVTSDYSNVVEGVNYQGVVTNVDFPAGEVLREVFVPLLDDKKVQTNTMIVQLNLTNASPSAGYGPQQPAQLIISNVDTAVSFQESIYNARKSDGFANIDVTRIGGNSTSCTVDFFTTTNGSALPGIDFIPTNAILSFLPGQSDVVIQVPIVNNNIIEGQTSVQMCLSNAFNTLLYSPSNATLFIQDTVTAPGDIHFATNIFVVNKNAGTANLSVIRTNGDSLVSVDYYIVAGTAQNNVNYIASSGTLTFNSGVAVQSISIPLIDNNLVQGTVNFSVILTNATSGASLVDPSVATVNILDDKVGFSFVSATNYVSDTNAYGAIFVQRIGALSGAYQVNYATTNSGTAVPNINYIPVQGTFTFQANETLKTILVPLIDNHQVISNLTFGISLFPTNSAQVVGITNALVIEQSGDAGFSFTNANSSVYKDSGIAVVTVICSNPSIEPALNNTNVVPLSVQYSTQDGTAIAGEDYYGVSGTLVFTNGIGTNTFTVPIIDNTVVQGDRSFTVKLLNPTAPGQLVAPSVQTIKIIDSNSGLRFSAPNYTAIRTNVSATVTILRTDNTNITSSVNFSTADGTAVAGLDYISTNGTVIFTNGEIAKSFQVTVIANNTVEPDKTVLLELSDPTPTNSVLLPPYTATITIHDTDGSFVQPAGSVLTGESILPANGIIDPNETVTVEFGFRAAGGNNVNNLKATLLATNGVSNPKGSGGTASQSYGSLTVGGPAVFRPFTFTALGTNSQQIAANFNLTDGTNNLGVAIFGFTLGTWTVTFSNTSPIIINDLAIATPYPASINISNLNGVVYNTTLSLTNLSHGSLADVNVLLVAPNQKNTLLMSHVGGENSVIHLTLTFDDAATNSLPQNSVVTSGTNKPTGYYSPGSIIFP